MIIRSYYLFLFCGGLIVFYLFQWLSMPLYPDEVAFYIQNTRTPIDGAVRFGLYSLCLSNIQQIPALLLPGTYTLSLLYFVKGWKLARLIPCLCIALLLLAIFYIFRHRKSGAWEILMLTAGFTGVSGSGLILSRPECILLLHAVTCLFTYGYCKKPGASPRAAWWFILLNMYACILSLYVHMQGLLLVPVSAILILRILRQHTKLNPLLCLLAMTAFFSAVSIQAYDFYSFHCSEDPEVEADMAYATTTARIAHGESIGKLLMDRMDKYTTRMGFSDSFQVQYLPEMNSKAYLRSARIINVLILCTVVASAAVLLLTLLYSFYQLWRGMTAIAGQHNPWQALYTVFLSDTALASYAICAWLALFFYDYAGNFYRTFSLNLLAAVLAMLALSATQNSRLRKAGMVLASIATITCIASAAEAGHYIKPLLEAGYTGPSIPLSTDWKSVRQRVDTLAKQCKLDKHEPNIVADDLTYDALKNHPHIMPVTYFWTRNTIQRSDLLDINKHNPENGAARLQSLGSVSHIAIVRCGNFNTMNIAPDYSDGDLCCKRY